jgi:hypothetical protein
MPPPLVPDDPGLLASVLDTASLGGSAVRNLLRGDPGAMFRNLVDIPGRSIDALLPGDWIPDASGPGDRPEFRDVVDLGGDNLLTDTLNFAGDVLTDPLTYVPGAAVAKAGSLAKQGVSKGVQALPKSVSEPLAKGADKVGQKVRATFGAQRVSKGTEGALRAKQAAADLVGRAGSEGAVDALSGLSERELLAMGEVGHNMRLDPATGKPAALLDPSESMNFDQRLAKLLADEPALNPERLLAAAPKFRDTLRSQWDAAQQPASSPGGGVFFNKPSAGTPDVVMGGMASAPSQGVRDYFPRQFSGMKADGLDEITGLPKPIAERADWRDSDILEYLRTNPDVALEFNAAKALAQRMGTQGELAGRAQVGQSIFDMAKAGQVELPDELLEKFVARSAPAKAVVGSGKADVSRLLGGDTTGRSAGLLGIGEQSGKAIVPVTGDIAPRSPNAALLGEQSGKSVAPVTPEIEARIFDPYGIGSFSGKSKPPATEAIVDAGQESLDLYGLGSVSGKSKPPVTAPIEESVSDIYGLGAQSGKAKPPTLAEIAERSANAGLVGEQSGKSIVGRSVTGEEVAPALRQMELGSQSGKAVVGKSTAPTIKGLKEEERQRAKDWLLSQDFRLADPELRSAAQAIAKQFPEEEATVLLNALNGMAPRGAFTSALAKLNSKFKPFAVYGAIIPKLGSITRNLTGGLWQQFSNAEARGDIGRAAASLIPNWLKSVDDGVEKLLGTRFSKNEFAEVDQAFKLSGGDPRKALAAIKDPTMREAVEKGVLGNTFVNTEQLISSAAKGGWKALGGNLMDYPGAMFKGAEQRMRYGLYKSLRAKGKSADEAAKTVSDTFYDYSISGAENRLARDLIPFFQFTAKAIPQQAKLLAERPYVLSGIANLSGGSEGEPLPPWMEGKINIPLGQDEQGNQQVLANLGLPVEALNWLPNPSADLNQFGRQVQQNQAGSLQPLLKTGVAAITGEDPMFGTPFGSYTKVGGQDLGRPGAAINQLLGTGLPGASAISGLLGMGSKVTDDRTSLGDKAINLLTGAKVTSVDPDVALRQRLQSYLENNPNVQQFRTFFQNSEDDDTQGLIKALTDAKKRIKDKQAAAVPVN